MTGYADAQRVHGGVQYTLEIRTLNHRYYKQSIKLPERMQFVEPAIEKLLRAKISRGSVTLVLRIRNETESAAYDVNQAALSRYAKLLGSVSLPENAQATVDLASLSALPGVCQPPELSENERRSRAALIEETAAEAIANLITMRRREGEVLYEDLCRLCQEAGRHLATVADRAPVVVAEYHDRLTDRVEALMKEGRFELDRDVVAREVAIYAERCDISEEISRLNGHLAHFEEVCRSDDAVGRKLDFLAQEMLREANTIGSKSNDAAIARAVVELKTMIDRIKEQVQNVE